MHIPPYLLATLLTLAPTSVYASGYGCSHFKATYQMPCNQITHHCSAGDLDATVPLQVLDAFDKLKKDFAAWAGIFEQGGECGGYCTKNYYFTPKGFTGQTWATDCIAGRMRTQERWKTPAPPPPPFLQKLNDERDCDVHCSGGYGRTCVWFFGEC
ncbi:hypothetical protein FKW77_010435 [Venturia effusa]|uniref:Uncharacterized protein n=1 Tax=Venturia effusa TaxID=50376 RepID=A0A517KXR3_9PEZI|nr:hypothetical protein FKW77_010435 [Venturia effusa]